MFKSALTDFRLKLNNKLAGRGEIAVYECSSTGPQNGAHPLFCSFFFIRLILKHSCDLERYRKK